MILFLYADAPAVACCSNPTPIKGVLVGNQPTYRCANCSFITMGCSCCSNPNHVTTTNSRGHWVYKCRNCGAEC